MDQEQDNKEGYVEIKLRFVWGLVSGEAGCVSMRS